MVGLNHMSKEEKNLIRWNRHVYVRIRIMHMHIHILIYDKIYKG